MKKLISFSALCLTIVLSVQSVSAQGTTTLIMKDGTQQEGYLRSPFYSTIQYVDLSQSPTAKPRRYPIGEINRIVMVGLDGDTVNYVREIRYRMFKSNSPDTKKEKGRYRMPVLFREDYRGKDGIALLTEFRETEQTIGLRTAPQKERWCYVKTNPPRGYCRSAPRERTPKARRKTSSGSPNRLSPTIRIWCNESRATNFRSRTRSNW